MHPGQPVMIDSYGLSDVGKKRAVNEDQMLIASLNKGMMVQQTTLNIDDQTQITGGFQGKLLMVADGIGGQTGGDRASGVAVQSITNYILNTMPWFFRLDQSHEEDLKQELVAAIERTQRAVQNEGAEKPELKGMGTTLTLAYVLWPRLYLVHAGDSRCYLQRGNELRQLTTDHSMAQKLVERGALEPAEAEDSRWEHVLYKAIVADGEDELRPDVYKARLQSNDTLLLCTDGLTKHVSDEAISGILSSVTPLEEICQNLVDTANADGGSDNVTVVVARFLPAGGHSQ